MCLNVSLSAFAVLLVFMYAGPQCWQSPRYTHNKHTHSYANTSSHTYRFPRRFSVLPPILPISHACILLVQHLLCLCVCETVCEVTCLHNDLNKMLIGDKRQYSARPSVPSRAETMDTWLLEIQCRVPHVYLCIVCVSDTIAFLHNST